MLLPHYDQNSITTWHAQTRVNYSTSHSFSGNWITYEIIFLFSDDAYPWFRNITDLRAIQKCGCHRHVAVIAIVFLKISLIGPLRYWIVNCDETLGLPSYLYGGQVNACAEALKISVCLQASAFEHILMKISVRKNEKKNQKSKIKIKKKYRLKKFSFLALLNENIKLCLNISWLTDTCRPLPLKNYISRCRVILWGGSVSDRTDWSALYLSYLCSNTDIVGFCTSLLSLCLFPYCLVPAATYY